MITPQDFRRIDTYLFEIPKTFRSDMRVPARFYVAPELLESILGDRSLEQLVNVATLPGIVKYALAMPDIHQGYGFPIGGVAATALPDGIISPGGVGYDINCGVRLLGTQIHHEELAPHLDELASMIYINCPSGVGKGGHIKLERGELAKVAQEGSRWALRRGLASEADLERTEEGGCIAGADFGKISERAKDRGKSQVGTLGAGNHFIEIDRIDEVLDDIAARKMGLFPGQITVQIHCGSRGFGHQICSDYVKKLQKAVQRYNLVLPDRELVSAPLSSPDGQNYLAAMRAAANYAFANRQVLVWHIRRSFEQVLAGKLSHFELYQVYDVAHNIAKIEKHTVDGQIRELCVHRKGATRAFGPGSPDVPGVYRSIGQPVLVPGSMGTASWVLLGTRTAMESTFGSSCHGAGRTLSRAAAKRAIRGSDLRSQLSSQGIILRYGSLAGLAEEAPMAYKDVSKVIESVAGSGIVKKVARMVPLAVIKG